MPGDKKVIEIKVPCSTANLGPGFDVLGMALSLYLSVTVTIPGPDPNAATFDYHSSTDNIKVPSTIPDNLITRVAAYIAAAHNSKLPKSMHIKIENEIPLGRGLGSSGTAVVAGVLMGDAVCDLGLPRDRLLDYCNFIEGHPDNTTASLIGGFTASYLSAPYTETFDDVVLEDDSEKHNPNKSKAVKIPILPTHSLGKYVRLGLSPLIRAVVVIPDFELHTKLAREVLPTVYTRADAVFNLQRLGVLTVALGQQEPDAEMISEAMQDCLHQKYRQHLIPGLTEILSLRPKDIKGLLGVCMSGAGPTVLAFAMENFEAIGTKIQDIFANSSGSDGQPIKSIVKILEIEKAVTLHTDLGEMKIEIFCESTPRAAENFLALCASGYYDNCLFHRNIKGFMIQTGDPTGTGKGGNSIWGGYFADEIKTTLKHNARGTVSMANKGPDTNGSQFFIAYGKQQHLDSKHTVFGRVIDGLETLDALEKIPVDPKTYKPIQDLRIKSITVHANPIADSSNGA